MLRRLFGLLICVLMLGAATSEFYNLANKNILPLQLRFEASYVAVDPPDDFGEPAYPAQIASASPRANTIIKLMLSASVRTFRFHPPMGVVFERSARSRPTCQDLFRLEKVFRI